VSGAAARTVGIRVSTEGADRARRELEQFGVAGEAALRRLEVASLAASPGLQRLAGASDIATRAFQGIGGSMGTVASTFAGVSVAAGGLTAGFVAMGAEARQEDGEAVALQCAQGFAHWAAADSIGLGQFLFAQPLAVAVLAVDDGGGDAGGDLIRNGKRADAPPAGGAWCRHEGRSRCRTLRPDVGAGLSGTEVAR
jgi:hypothetical protein